MHSTNQRRFPPPTSREGKSYDAAVQYIRLRLFLWLLSRRGRIASHGRRLKVRILEWIGEIFLRTENGTTKVPRPNDKLFNPLIDHTGCVVDDEKKMLCVRKHVRKTCTF
jgi:hypothetical protein